MKTASITLGKDLAKAFIAFAEDMGMTVLDLKIHKGFTSSIKDPNIIINYTYYKEDDLFELGVKWGKYIASKVQVPHLFKSSEQEFDMFLAQNEELIQELYSEKP